MKITHINNTDLPGRIFNGYDMMNTLNSLGHNCKQIVVDKRSDNENVFEFLTPKQLYVKNIISAVESQIGTINLLMPFTNTLIENDAFKTADIVHFHLLHNNMISIYELNKLLKSKPCVWTLHDPWIFTGHCVYPLDCSKWKIGCEKCERAYDAAFPLHHHTADQMWKIKKEQLQDIDIDIIVSTDFMVNYIKQSPITSHFTRIHKIPFGIDLNSVRNIEKKEAKKRLNIPESDFVIGIRDEENKIKGVKYFIEAVQNLDFDGMTIISVGGGNMLEELSNKYQCIKLGWRNDPDMMDLFYSAADVFVMPSLAESFGLMSIEAMAHETPVISFENTVLTEITHSNECGISAEYANSGSLSEAISRMRYDPAERIIRGKKSRELVSKEYRYDNYVTQHLKLYKKILEKVGEH